MPQSRPTLPKELQTRPAAAQVDAQEVESSANMYKGGVLGGNGGALGGLVIGATTRNT